MTDLPLPESFLRELHEKNDIVSVVSAYVTLRRRGRTQVGLCPFHSEKSPSFTVYPDTDSFYCFGCAAGGDAITFIKRIENLDYIDAVSLLAQRSGMQMPAFEREQSSESRELRLRILEANRETARFYYSTLYSGAGKRGLAYLRDERRLTDGTIKAFGLGFAPDERSALYSYLTAKGFRPSELIQANLIFQGRSGGYVDRFRNRAMFPIIDTRGNVIAFGGRAMEGDTPKYLNTSDTPVYKKTNNLYSLNRAKNSKADRLIVCEGYMDVIALGQAGFDNVVGGLGTALTEEQVKLISRYTSTVVLCYDADEAGQKAAVRAMKMFDKAGVDIKVLKVPDGKDPDEYIKHHGANGYIKFKALVENALSDVDYFYEMLRQKYNTQTPDGRMKALEEAAHFLSELSNPVKRDIYAGKISAEMGVKRESLDAVIDADLRAIDRRDSAAQQRRIRQAAVSSLSKPPETAGTGGSRRSQKAEEALLACLTAHPELISSASQRLTPDKFTSPFASKLFSLLCERAAQGKSTQFGDIAGEFSEEENMRFGRMLAQYNEMLAPGVSEALCSDYIDVIISESKKQTTAALSQQSDEEVMRYLAGAAKDGKSRRKA